MPIPQLTPSDGETYDASQKPPPFGHALKRYFALDEDYVNLNNGSYGTPPLPVLFAVQRLGYEIERNPDRFHRLTYQPLLDKARAGVAKLIGADTDEVVLVPNATHALNTVLRNFEWRAGDVLLGATTTYGAIANTIRYLADRAEQPRPTARFVEYTFPLSHAQIVARFRAELRVCKSALANAAAFTDVPPLSPGYAGGAAEEGKGNKIVAVIDSITANPGALMPWKEMVRVCREEGVWSVIDGAHSIGQEPDINLSEAKPDFWVSNCHKWCFAKRGCAVLYVPKRNQHVIKSSIPTSHQYVSPHSDEAKTKGTNFVKQHEWTGTADLAPYLSANDALEFRAWLGGEQAINDYCHRLALDGGKKLAEVMGTRVLDEDGELTVNMPNVLLPLPVEKTPGEVYTREQLMKIYTFLEHQLLLEWKAYAALYYHGGAWWCRCSAQVFNEVSDFEYLGKAVNAVCKEIKDTILSEKAGQIGREKERTASKV